MATLSRCGARRTSKERQQFFAYSLSAQQNYVGINDSQQLPRCFSTGYKSATSTSFTSASAEVAQIRLKPMRGVDDEFSIPALKYGANERHCLTSKKSLWLFTEFKATCQKTEDKSKPLFNLNERLHGNKRFTSLPPHHHPGYPPRPPGCHRITL